MEQELRIARQIQMSLLPRGPLDFPGISMTALCVPAREVGGDYYDFFHLPGDRLGILIADVSGKGTSAALYMAELKGLVLALSHRYDSPRDLLIEVGLNDESRHQGPQQRFGVDVDTRAGFVPLGNTVNNPDANNRGEPRDNQTNPASMPHSARQRGDLLQ